MLSPIKCSVICIALCLHASQLCSFILHIGFLLINVFCQRKFNSFACVSPVKGTYLVDLVFTWNHEPR